MQVKKTYKAAIFDLDGILLNTIEDVADASTARSHYAAALSTFNVHATALPVTFKIKTFFGSAKMLCYFKYGLQSVYK